MNCSICSNKKIALNPDIEIHKEVIRQLDSLIDDLCYGELEQKTEIEINTLAEQYDGYLYYGKCERPSLHRCKTQMSVL